MKAKSNENQHEIYLVSILYTSNYGLLIVAKSFVDYYLYGINTNTGRQVF